MQADKKTLDALASTSSKASKKIGSIAITDRERTKNDFNPSVATTSNALAHAGAGITGSNSIRQE